MNGGRVMLGRNRTNKTTEQEAAGKAIGEKLAASAPTVANLVDHAHAGSNESFDDFVSGFAASVIQGDGPWLEWLFDSLRIDGPTVQAEDRAGLKVNADEWSVRRSYEPWEILEQRLDTYSWHHGEHFASLLASKVDFRRWLASLEDCPSPVWVQSMFQGAGVSDDFGLTLQVLADAEPVFVDWCPTGRLLGFVAARGAVEHCLRIEQGTRPEGTADDLLQERISDLAAQFAVTILNRRDSEPLAASICAFLASRHLFQDGDFMGRKSYRTPGLLLKALCSGLAQRGSGIKLFKRLDGVRQRARTNWKAQKPVVSVKVQPEVSSRLVAEAEGAPRGEVSGFTCWVAAVVIQHAPGLPSHPGMDELWCLLSSLLSNRDAGITHVLYNANSTGRSISIAANVLAGTTNPLEQWREAYAATESHRRRSQHRNRYADIDVSRPTILLIHVGVATAAELAKRGSDKKSRLFDEVEKAARRQWLIGGWSPQTDWTEMYAIVLSATYTIGGMELLLQFISPYQNSDRLIGLTLERILMNSNTASDSMLDTFEQITGLSLVRVVDKLRKWEYDARIPLLSEALKARTSSRPKQLARHDQ